MQGMSYRLGGLAFAALLLVVGGCSTSLPASGRSVRVVERDFRISAPPSAPAGDVRLSVSNRGPDAHELIIVRAQDSRLPLRTDGSTVDEEALERVTAGVLEAGDPGTVRELQLHLAPGRYQMLCNMSGHYLGGMKADFVVR
jgi:hypothetical protein